MSHSLGLSTSTPGNHNPYEGGGGTFSIHIGRIIDVNAEARLCRVSGMMGSDWGPVWMQYLCADTNPDGDESGSIPRKGSMGLVFVVGGEAFIWGYFRPVGKGASCKQGPESVTLGEGDKIMSTSGGNRITLKRSGLVELYCKDTLQRLMFPVGSRIADICREYNLKADGGVIEWPVAEPVTGNTLWDAEFAMQIVRAFVVHEQKGYVSSDIILKTTVGPAFPGVKGSTTPTYVHTVGINGETTTTVSPPQFEGTPTGFKSVIGPDGSIQILAGLLQKVVMSINTTGDVSLDVNEIAHMGVSATGDIIANNKVGEASISATGDIALKNKIGEATIAAAGDIAIKNKTGEATIAAAGDIALKNKMGSATMSSKGDIEIKGPTVTITMSAAGEMTVSAVKKVSITSKAEVEIKAVGGITVESSAGPVNITAKGAMPVSLAGKGMQATDSVLCWPTTLSPFTGAPLMPYSQSIMVSK